MATNPKTWGTIKTILQAEIEQNTDTPDADDTAYWLIIANRLIADWEKQAEWKELWTYETAGGTVAAGTTNYPCDTDVRYLSEHVELHYTNDQIAYIPLVSTRDKQYWSRVGERFAYLTGKPGSYVLTLGWTPATTGDEVGATIKYPYYKFATTITGDSDVMEMSDPNWIVDALVSEVSNSANKKALFGNRAQASLDMMLMNNEDAYSTEVPDDELGLGI